MVIGTIRPMAERLSVPNVLSEANIDHEYKPGLFSVQ